MLFTPKYIYNVVDKFDAKTKINGKHHWQVWYKNMQMYKYCIQMYKTYIQMYKLNVVDAKLIPNFSIGQSEEC